MKTPIKLDDLGDTFILGNPHISKFERSEGIMIIPYNGIGSRSTFNPNGIWIFSVYSFQVHTKDTS